MKIHEGTLLSYIEMLRERGADEVLVRTALAGATKLTAGTARMPLLDVPVAFNTRLETVAGRAFPTRIELNMELELGCTATEFLETLLHEAAHCAAFEIEHGHGYVWKACCRTLGIKPIRCHSYPTMQRRSR